MKKKLEQQDTLISSNNYRLDQLAAENKELKLKAKEADSQKRDHELQIRKLKN